MCVCACVVSLDTISVIAIKHITFTSQLVLLYVSLACCHLSMKAVMKRLVEEKLPNLSNHLEENGIDVTVVTFNWFLTLFIDALPTEVMIILKL